MHAPAIRQLIDGRPYFRLPDGRLIPGVAGGEDPPAGPPAEPPAEPPNPADPPADKTFSQADVDRIVQERLRRDREKFADYEELKQAAVKLQELEDGQRSDLERAQRTAQQAAEELAAARADAEAARQFASTTQIRSAVVAEAAKQGAVDPDAVVALLPTDSVTVGDDGQVTGAEDAVKALLEQKQYLVGQPRQPGPGDGGPRTPAPQKDLDEQIAEAEAKGDVKTSLALKTQKLAQAQQKE